jgi:hypothetical protein
VDAGTAAGGVAAANRSGRQLPRMGKPGRDLVVEMGIEVLETTARIEVSLVAEASGLAEAGIVDAAGVFEAEAALAAV